MRDDQNIRDVAQLDIDMIGFNFWPKSKRYVSMIKAQAAILPDFSRERLDNVAGRKDNRQCSMPKNIRRVGVFVDEMPQTIVTHVYNFSLDYVQLHGSELPVAIENLRSTLVPDIAPNIKVIKAFGINSAKDFEQTKDYEGVADLFLFDYKCPGKGGSGQHFDWSLLDAYKGNTPFLLSGGIGPDDVDELMSISNPMFAGVDVNSRFETAPAMKDVGSLRRFVDALRKKSNQSNAKTK